jgi:hypothetical protein
LKALVVASASTRKSPDTPIASGDLSDSQFMASVQPSLLS